MGDNNHGRADSLTEERIALSMERIRQIPEDTGVSCPFHDFFSSVSRFLLLAEKLRHSLLTGTYCSLTLKEMQEVQAELYRDMLPEHYGSSWLNPAAAAERLRDGALSGEDAGRTARLLTALYAEEFSILRFIFEDRPEDIAPVLELFLQIYGLYSGGDVPQPSQAEEAFYWYVFDYLDVTVPERNRELLVPGAGSAGAEGLRGAIPAEDPRSLFLTGDYISEATIRTAECLRDLDGEQFEKSVRALTEGFTEGFRVMGRDLSKKKTVAVRYLRGFERMAERAAEIFRGQGLETVFPGSPVRIADRLPGSTERQLSLSPNRQFDYDHRYDQALFWDKALVDRKLAELKASYEELKEQASLYAGPAVMEYFGEKEFVPENRPDTCVLSPRQRKLLSRYRTELSALRDQYMPGDETSFTIIAWPIPEIGPFYRELFDDIVRINTGDNEQYRRIQQRIIDVLDRCSHVELKGAAGNETELRVALRELKDPARETRFENCVSDVNIPAGEVFTSPVLAGTEGTLHVREVFVDGLQLKDLKIRIRGGMAAEYSCGNFPTEEENRALVREAVLGDHETLPVGEFAIGTNTLACAVAKKYGIGRQMPILIAEKTGPHFAFGDTCYSHEEDTMTYNPDGKAIIARDNEISARRKEDPGAAYFGHHKDITVPYGEIGALTAVMPDGSREDIIRDGRFVLEGTRELNGPLEFMVQ